MQITLGDVKRATYSRMFLEDNEYDEYDESILLGINHGLLDLANLFPIKAQYEITQTASTDEGENEYDIRTLTQEGGINKFIRFANPALLVVSGGDTSVAFDFKIIADRYLHIKKNYGGTFKVQYYRFPAEISNDTDENYEFDIDAEAANLLPLYATWWAMQDDDIQTATMAYNEYQEAKQTLRDKQNWYSGIEISGGYDI